MQVMLTPTEKIWHNGAFIPWNDAKIHVLSHVVSYGSSVFEGIRSYETKSGAAVFRLREHIRRMLDSCKIYRMAVPFSLDQLADGICELVRVNKLKACYIRPIVFRGYGSMGVNGSANPTEVYLACWEWGRYLGAEAIEGGVDVCVSSWNRIAPNTLPALAKAGANYMNSQLIKMEALANGFDEGIGVFCDHERREARCAWLADSDRYAGGSERLRVEKPAEHGPDIHLPRDFTSGPARKRHLLCTSSTPLESSQMRVLAPDFNSILSLRHVPLSAAAVWKTCR